MKVRVRFAPSPTGSLHFGGFKTALLNFLFARKHNGTFILRVEDTDQARTIPGASDQIEDDLNWLQLKPDESPRQGGDYGPYTQSQRLELYNSYIPKLMDSSAAYECFCAKKRLVSRFKGPPNYDDCRNLTRSEVVRRKSSGEPYVIKLKFTPGLLVPVDMQNRKIVAPNQKDPILVRGDGIPTYYYANVVDDHSMEITHILRGIERMTATAINYQLYRAFDWQPPQVAHLPILLSSDGSKLSKRQGDMSIRSFREKGEEAICLINFVTTSGGGFYRNVDKIQSIDELAEQLDISKLKSAAGKLNFDLLPRLNRVHLREKIENNSDELLSQLKAKHPAADEEYLTRVLHAYKGLITSLNDLESESMRFLWSHPNPADFKIETSRESLIDFKNHHDMHKIRDFIQAHGLNTKIFLNDLQNICCGLNNGPSIVELFDLLGLELVKTRLERAIQHMK